MLSPFPGMNPYLEKPARWTGFHNQYLGWLSGMLNHTMPERYFADVEERVYILPDEKRTYVHDVGVTLLAPASRSGGGVAVADAADTHIDPSFCVSYYTETERELFLTIRDVENDDRVVTAIELLSPTNKDAHPGRDSYLNKQRDLLDSQTHFIEIDLLRAGTYTVAVPVEFLPHKSEWDYMVCLHRGGTDNVFDTWPTRLRNRLPRIAVPLDAGVPDVALDLQAALERCYEEAGYWRKIDYRGEPVPPLSPNDSAWADALLREKGLRP